MDKKLYLCVVIIYLIEASVASYCTVRNEGHCYFTVNCESPSIITNIIPQCDDADPYVTFAISESSTQNITANFFQTRFDSFVRIFTADSNNWTAVQNLAFSNFKNVLYMDLSCNQIKNIGTAFKGLEVLDSLNLSRNHLEVIRPETLMISENKNRLYLLDLSYNFLTYLSADMFVNLNNLQKLYLQGNNLTTFRDEHFRYLKNLSYLNICCGNLRMLNMTTNYLMSLKYLDVSCNKIDIFNVTGISLEAIDLSHNNIKEFMCDQLPYLLKIDLSYNKIENVSCNNLQNLQKLHNEYVQDIRKPLIKIDLNNNQISNMSLKDLNLSFNNISIFNMPGLTSLETIDLSHNNIEEFGFDNYDQSPNLLKLDFSSNKIKNVSPNNLQKFNNEYDQDIRKPLINIGLNHNKISNMSLKHLNLSYNKINIINVSRITSLETIDLSHNEIKEFAFDYLDQSPKLLRVDLSHNKLENISCNNLPKHKEMHNDNEEYIKKPLLTIKLNDNNIRNIDSNFFLIFNRIRYLTLRKNEITEFSPGTFQHVKFLKVLNVSNCRLNLTEETFRGLYRTEFIDITNNDISILDAKFFRDCKKLKRIKAEDNKIKTVNSTAFMILLPRLCRMNLKGNPVAATGLVMEIGNAVLIGLILVVIMLLLLYASIHRRVIFVHTLKCRRFILMRNRLIK